MTISTLSTRCFNHSPNMSHYEHDVSFNDTVILTTVTNSPSVVDEWVAATATESIHGDGHMPEGRRLLVGLDTEWRLVRGHPIAILQLCVKNRCLIFQLLWASHIPESLTCFLSHSDHVFVGVGVANDAKKLRQDFGLEVSNTVDLAKLAPSHLEPSIDMPLNPGLRFLALKVLGVDMVKPKSVTKSPWDDPNLSIEQVQYACVDAYVSFEIGRIWGAWESEYIVVNENFEDSEEKGGKRKDLVMAVKLTR